MSLLPTNASLLERALVETFTQLLYRTPNPYPALMRSDEAPEHMLPWLAQDKGVREWHSQATEEERRKTIANTLPVRICAGTRKGVRLAVEPLGYDAQITVDTQKPFHFTLTAFKRPGVRTSGAVVDKMHARLVDAKSLRDAYEFQMGVMCHASLGFAGRVTSGMQFSEVYTKASYQPMITASATGAVSGCTRSIVFEEIYTKAKL